MKKITLNNLAALVQGREMTLYQRSLAVQEFDSVVNYLRELEESEKANVSHTGERQSNILNVSNHVCHTCKGTGLVYIDDVIKNTLCPDC